MASPPFLLCLIEIAKFYGIIFISYRKSLQGRVRQMQNSFLSHSDAALRNRNTILHYVKKHGPISRTDIWESLNISRASVTQVIRQLQDSDLIVETGEGESTGGRKPRFITFNGSSKKLFAFDWSSHTACLMDLDGKILSERSLCFPSSLTPLAFADILKKALDEIAAERAGMDGEIMGLGLALPGLIDPRSNTVVYSVELNWQAISIQGLFADRFGENIFLERTGNMMALGEYAFGAARNADHFELFILSADGIGVSTVIHGRCQHGASYMYGELGHIKVPSDVICSCGQRGCLEAVVNSLLLRSGGSLTDEILEYLAIGVSAALNISDAATAILVGSFVDQLTPAQEVLLCRSIREKVTGQHLRKLDIRFTREIKKITLQGISANVFDRYFSID